VRKDFVLMQVPTCPQSPLSLNVNQRSKELTWMVTVDIFTQRVLV